MRPILGISAFYHDSAAALVSDGRILAAAQEERFSRRKNDDRFPVHAVAFCLRQAGLRPEDLAAVVFYDKPILKFARVLECFLARAPRGLTLFPRVLPGWLSGKLDLRSVIRSEIPDLPKQCPILFTSHHLAHAASAFYPSPFQEAAILTVDGVGEWQTTVIARGQDNRIEMLRELRFPHSLGMLYSAFTAYCGFRVNSGEYKLMGLAPYGEPRHVDAILEHLLDLKPDGSFRLNLDYFSFLEGKTMTNERLDRLFGGPPRKPETAVEPRFFDVARSIQEVTNTAMLRLARHTREVTGSAQLCLAGGVALNCVANGLILKEGIFEKLWIQPAAGDAGGALGAALTAAFRPELAPSLGWTAAKRPDGDGMQGAFLGPEFLDAEVEAELKKQGAVYTRLQGTDRFRVTAELLAGEKVVGWFQGRMEFGPRALGNRSILGDPRSPRMQSVLNLKVKFRESFRPFAPAARAERVQEFFTLPAESPYMLLVAPVREELRRPVPAGLTGLERLRHPHSTIPAVTHVDGSARVQTVDAARNPTFYSLLEAFEARTGCPVLINTSFNVRGEPVVCTPEDAYRCFLSTEMDALVIGSFLLLREDQPRKNISPPRELVPD